MRSAHLSRPSSRLAPRKRVVQTFPSARATFGDTFGAIDVATGKAHIWQPGETVTFNFSVTGAVQSTLSAADMAALDKDFESQTRFLFKAYKPGTFDLLAKQEAIFQDTSTSWWDPQSQAFAELQRLNNEIDALKIATTYGWLGRPYSPYGDFSSEPYKEFSADVPTVFSASFAPGGNFEWWATLEVSTRFEADIPLRYRPTFVIDFSHTVSASFVGPDGTVTTSASGSFPNTLLAQPEVSAVPEPEAYTLALAGLAAAALLARKRRA